MARYREIRGRIVGIENTAKITQAMKMVAAAKLRRAQDAIIAARPYGRKLQEILQYLATNMETAVSPLLAERDVERVCLVVVAADRGLCGPFNTNVLRAATTLINGPLAEFQAAGKLDMVTIGKRAVDFFAKRNVNVVSAWPGIFNVLEFSTARTIVDELRNGFIERKYDQVLVVYNEFKSVVKQNVVEMQLLPIPRMEVSDTAPLLDYIFEPSQDELLDALLPKHLNTQFWNVLLESNAAEQGARMTAMENATQNSKELVRTLRLQYNKARQEAITKEILEIVSGAEALSQQ